MAGIIKNVVRLGVITTLAGGAVVVVAGPQRCMAVFHQAKQHVNGVIDSHIDGPIALRAQLRNLEAKYPARIREVENDLFEIQQERGQLERELAVDTRAVEITQGKLAQLNSVLTRGEELGQEGNFVRIRFEHDRMDMPEGYRLADHFTNLLVNFQASADEKDLFLDMLIDQENQIADVLNQLQAEQAEFQTQLSQLDRQVDAIARNDRLIDLMEERQASFSKYDNPYTAPNSETVKAKIYQELANQEKRIAELGVTSQTQDILDQAKADLTVSRDIRKSFQNKSFHRGTIELEPQTIEISPDDEESFETESEIASRGG